MSWETPSAYSEAGLNLNRYNEGMKYADFLKQEKRCPFDTPITQIMLDQCGTAFLTYALAPYSPDHWLVIPTRHVGKLTELTHEEQDDIDRMLSRGLKALTALGHHGVSILLRQGEGTGKTVEHLHYHLIPDTHVGDLDHDPDNRPVLSEEEQREAAARGRGALKSL